MTEGRIFSKTYHDFLYNDLLNGEEKIIFVALKVFLTLPQIKTEPRGRPFQRSKPSVR